MFSKNEDQFGSVDQLRVVQLKEERTEALNFYAETVEPVQAGVARTVRNRLQQNDLRASQIRLERQRSAQSMLISSERRLSAQNVMNQLRACRSAHNIANQLRVRRSDWSFVDQI
ncbi:pentatricopeptide repeat-containing protein chloroplastic [Dorcoceras hygrometricum]|uniref:Pentatricopeptide repeat-containing protein chloroplastic n=1 Tax=Dorcoceras hygrometricum TaxID=472368 RepID=A0A2Z7DBT8_9LAMI|nr:pentatricopeptide repeat-containing protein chloroplastic [Dorcoceras hygrometricum]